MRNAARYDARVLRAAGTLRGLTDHVLILAVTSTSDRERETSADGVPILRLTPRSPFERLRRVSRTLRQGRKVKAELATTSEAADSTVPAPLLAIHHLLRTVSYYRRAISLIRGWRPQIVHCNDYNTMWIGVAARFLVGSAVIYDAHELWPDRNQRSEPRWWLVLCEYMFVRVAHGTITTSPGYAEVMQRRYRTERPVLVRNIPETPPTGGKPVDPPGGGPLAAYVGAITSNRGLEQAIAALVHAPQARLRLLGPGNAPFQAKLQRLAEQNAVAARVEFSEPVPPDRVVEAIADADLGLALIQPSCLSYSLSLPNKVFEYLAAGLPVLGSDLPVIGDFVREHGIGLLAHPTDDREIGTAIMELTNRSRNGNFVVALERARTDLRWSEESKTLRSVYERCLIASGHGDG